LFYERAKRLDPSNESINLNLKIANLKIVDKIKPIPEFFITKFLKNLAKSKSADTFSWLGILFIWIGFIFLTALFMNNKIRLKSFICGAVVSLFIVVFSFYLAYESNQFLKKTNEGIVLVPSVYVKSSPDTESLDVFILHEEPNLQLWTIWVTGPKLKLLMEISAGWTNPFFKKFRFL